MPKPQPVTLFIQCLVDGLYPEVAEAVVQVFKKLNIDVDYPLDQTCCGQPAFNAGYRQEAKTAARHFIEIFEKSHAIVCPSGSCVSMVRRHYEELFAKEPRWQARADAVAAKTYELTEYLVDVLGITDLGARYDGTVTYHDSCHLLRVIGVQQQPRQLIRYVKNTQFVEMPDSDQCCGFGGSFAFKYGDISTAMVAEKVKNIQTSGADTVVGCDMGCLMNIQGYINRNNLPIKTLHIAQLLSG